MPKDGPIIQDKPLRRPGARRQLIMGLFAVAVITVLAVGSYFFLRRKPETFTLRSYDYARVGRKDLLDTLQITGIVDTRTEQLLAPQAGVLARILVSPGDIVKKGDLIAGVKADDLEDALAEAEGNLARKGQEREKLLAEHGLQEQTRAVELARLQAALDKALSDLGRAKRLYEAGASTKTQLTQAEEAADQARETLDQAKAAGQADETRFNLDLKNSDLDRRLQEEKVNAFKRRLAECQLRSPLDGQVIEIYADAGSYLDRHEQILAIADLSRPSLKLDVPEDKIEPVAPGQRATITLGGRVYRGEVSSVGLQAVGGSESSASTVEVEVAFQDLPDKVVPGGSATAEIILGNKQDALCLPRGQYLTTGDQVYVYRIEGNKARKLEVGFGLINTTEVEILSGLREGDEVIISGYQDFLSYEEILLQKEGGTKQ